jgi:hypothetical protein
MRDLFVRLLALVVVVAVCAVVPSLGFIGLARLCAWAAGSGIDAPLIAAFAGFFGIVGAIAGGVVAFFALEVLAEDRRARPMPPLDVPNFDGWPCPECGHKGGTATGFARHWHETHGRGRRAAKGKASHA